ncbi:MAG: carboxypeptidase-like regulatory domain-containing protein [Bacteroidales bacterium]|nr:carboxypeptidase-like regulatory domain-containing protein [Bacteroidales bacterium]
MLKHRIIVLLFLLAALPLCAQQGPTGLQGKVVDAVTGEPVPFVQIVFDGTVIGTSTDMDGKFLISNGLGHTALSFRMMGYEPLKMRLEAGKVQKRATVKMTPQSRTLGEVQITAKKGKGKYTRKNNPAVELAKKVIANKEQNRVEALPRWRRNIYERLTMSLDDFRPDFEGKRLWRKLNFLEKYIDETEFDASPILAISMRESFKEQSYRKKPQQLRTLTTGHRMEGVDEVLSDEGIDENLQAMFSPVDIYDGDIELMLNHFVSPLSPLLATTFYKFYITDTLDVDGQRCVELSFVPSNKQSYGFTGQMYVSLDADSTFALTRYVMTVSKHVNLNFVRDLSIVQTYRRDGEGHWLPYRCDTYGRLYIHKKIQEIYVHQMRVFTDYSIGDTTQLLPDSLFTAFTNEATLPKGQLKRYKREFNEGRPVQLSAKQTVLDSMWVELRRLPEFRFLKATGELFVSGYLPTHRQRKQSRLDIGPVFNTLSFNHVEGWRVRLGGMTTAKLHPQHFGEGYIAYGFRDQRPKFNATYIYTFDEKERHAHEGPFSSLSLMVGYDLQTPGQAYDNFDRDNIMMSSDKEFKAQYVAQTHLRLRKEWRSHLRLDTRIGLRRYQPAGLLHYQQYQEDGSLRDVSSFSEAEFQASLSFTPNLGDGTRRRETQSNLRRDAPTINLTHTVALLDGTTLFNTTDFSADKRFWLGAFGHIDARLGAGVVWNRVPYPRLYIPSGNSGLFLSSSAFNTMQPMEFIMDQYVSFFASYHLKGWILNHIPLINSLRLREVVGFNVLYGGLSTRNDPSVDPVGLYLFPEHTTPFGTMPYMEYSLGIENILKFLRVDFVRRLTYTEGMESRDCWFIRIDLKFSL